MSKVLLIEDDKMVQTVTSGILEFLNCSVDTAGSGAEALDYCKSNDYDLIFMDLGLPDTEGCELAVKIRAAGFKRPIIACTGRTPAAEAERCFNAGMEGFLQKPATMATLKDTLGQYLKTAA